MRRAGQRSEWKERKEVSRIVMSEEGQKREEKDQIISKNNRKEQGEGQRGRSKNKDMNRRAEMRSEGYI